MEKNNKYLSVDLIIKLVIVILIAFMCTSLAISFFNKKTPARQGSVQQASAGKGRGAASDKKVNDAVTVNVYKTKLEDIESTVRLNGEISSRSEVSIYPDTAGKLVRFTKEIGESVSKGDIIAYVDPSKPGASYRISPVLSTISGTIISKGASEGDTVSTGTVLAKVGSLSDLEITVNLAEKYSSSVKTNLHGYVSLISVPDENFDAVVTKVSPVVDKTKRTIELKLSFSRFDKRIKPGMFGTVRLATSRRENTIVVPKSAISSYNAESVVYVVDSENKARRKNIKLGLTNDNYCEILSGIEQGELVITAGSVTEGTSVKFLESVK